MGERKEREREGAREGKSFTTRLSEGWKKEGEKEDRVGIKSDLTFYNFPAEFPL